MYWPGGISNGISVIYTLLRKQIYFNHLQKYVWNTFGIADYAPNEPFNDLIMIILKEDKW